MRNAARAFLLALTFSMPIIGAESTCQAGFMTFEVSSAGLLTTTNASSSPTYNFSLTSANLQDYGPTQYNSPTVQSGLVFDLSALPNGNVITGASFTITSFFYQSNSVQKANVNLEGFRSSGTTLTQADFLGSLRGLGRTSLPGGGSTPIALSFDVTRFVQSAGPYVGFIQYVGGNVSFDGTGETGFPTLSITYEIPITVPEPSSLALGGIGGSIALWIACVRRRRLAR